MVKQKLGAPSVESEAGAPVNTDSREQPAFGYSKPQFLGSAKYASKKDLLNALLDDDTTYTPEQVDQLLDEFLKKEAK